MLDKYVALGLHFVKGVYYILKSDTDELKDCIPELGRELRAKGYHCVIPPRDCYIMWEKTK